MYSYKSDGETDPFGAAPSSYTPLPFLHHSPFVLLCLGNHKHIVIMCVIA